MKRIIFQIAYVVIFLFAISSCKKEIGLDDNLKFTKLTVEDQKKKIEDNGIAFIDEMDGMKETKAYTTLTDFVETSGAKAAPQMLYLKTAMESRSLKSIDVLNKQMRTVSSIDDEVWGEYVWDENIQEFEKTKDLTDKLIFKFPSSSADSKNNSVLTIDYTESKIEIPEADQYYPSKVACVLTIDGETAIEADFSGEYKADGTPLKVNNSLQIGDFKWAVSYSNDSKKAAAEYEFSNKSNTLIKMSSEINGNLTYNALSDAMDQEEMPDDLVTSGSVYFQVMNLAILGGVDDLKKMVDEVNALDNSDIDYDSKEYYDRSAEILNENVKLWACFVDDKRKFADVEFYFNESEDTYTYYDYVWNGKYYETIERTQTETYYELVPRLILSDGSKVDVEEFFQDGFDDFTNKLEDSFNDIEGIVEY